MYHFTMTTNGGFVESSLHLGGNIGIVHVSILTATTTAFTSTNTSFNIDTTTIVNVIITGTAADAATTTYYYHSYY